MQCSALFVILLDYVMGVAMTRIIENCEVYGLDRAVKSAKYPMAVDIDKLDSNVTNAIDRLAMTGTGEGHDQFLTGITVGFDLTCTIKMWTEIERYKFINFISSQSTMHRITKFNIRERCIEYTDKAIIEIVKLKIDRYNRMVDEKADPKKLEELYLEVLYSVPVGFKLTAGIVTNYRQLKTIYQQRKKHRLPEWRELCEFLTTLPNSHWITGNEV